jgi:hypothetical protein
VYLCEERIETRGGDKRKRGERRERRGDRRVERRGERVASGHRSEQGGWAA